MKILIVTGSYPPEIGGASHLIHGLAKSLHNEGHVVTIITGFPSYNLKDIPPKYRHGFTMKEVIENITIYRIRIPRFPRDNKIIRGIMHFVFGFLLSIVALFSPKSDVALVFSPPLPLPWFIELVGRLRHIPVIVNVQDLFPREAIELGILTNRILIRIFEAIETQVYRWAAAVTVHSPGNKEHVVRCGGIEKRTHVVFNWVDTEFIRPSPKINGFSRTHDLTDKFVVSYAGTMGWAQDMGTIIACANKLNGDTKIYFVLVGNGVEKDKYVEKSKKLGLTNILWLPMQPFSVYPEIIASSEISLINLHPELHTPVVPSKLLSIMAAGRAVIASLPEESDARQIISEANCGICVDAGDSEALASAIVNLATDQELLLEMGQRGRNFIEMHFSQQICTKQLVDIMMNVKGIDL